MKEIISLPELYERYSKDIFRYSFSILKNEDDAKDAVQEVFVKYAENESSFKRNCSYKTWFLVLTRNYCFNKTKSKDLIIQVLKNKLLLEIMKQVMTHRLLLEMH